MSSRVPAYSSQPAEGKKPAVGSAGARDGEGFGFWHSPEWMNLVSDILLLAVSVAIGYAVVKGVLRMPFFELRQVVVTSPLGQVTSAQLEYAAVSSLRGNFFTVNLDQARQAFEKLPWVRRAQVRRRWPATIEVSLEEQEAVAYWRVIDTGDMRLVNRQGEIFDAASNASMPMFSGPPERAAEMLTSLRNINTLLQPISRSVASLQLSERGAWQLKLDDGLQVELGRDQAKAPLEDRLRRFIAAWPEAHMKLDGKWAVADLRYPAGFAVRLAASSTSNHNEAGKKGTP
ncbi:MAG: cell division protein FtsQ/DivIB [Rhodocyclaceae bacterium]